jgi:hypothetical protein
LSPEICESKPYGKKSDIWSLGVVLFELLTFEMPFQASSLPALVHRICTTEPQYSKVEQGNYSRNMLDLVQCMLKKSAEKRPLTDDIVRLDFVKIHISKLLSFTLKAGSGGAQAAAADPNAPEGSRQQSVNTAAAAIDPEEAERNIERARQAQREKEREAELARERARAQAQGGETSSEPGSNREEYRNKMGRFYEERSGRSRRDRDDEGKDNNGGGGGGGNYNGREDKGDYGNREYRERDVQAPPRVDPRMDRQRSVPAIDGEYRDRDRDKDKAMNAGVGGMGRDRSVPALPSGNSRDRVRDTNSRDYAVAVGGARGNGYQMSQAQDQRTGAPMGRQQEFETAASR